MPLINNFFLLHSQLHFLLIFIFFQDWNANQRNMLEDELAKHSTPMYRAPEMLGKGKILIREGEGKDQGKKFQISK